MSNENYPIFYDFDYRGGVDATGAMRQVWNEGALNNAIKMWLASYTGEIIRRPQSGGYVTSALTTPMGQVDSGDLEEDIRAGLSADFRPLLRVQQLTVTPDYENRVWSIYLSVYSPDTGIYTQVSERIRSLV